MTYGDGNCKQIEDKICIYIYHFVSFNFTFLTDVQFFELSVRIIITLSFKIIIDNVERNEIQNKFYD